MVSTRDCDCESKGAKKEGPVVRELIMQSLLDRTPRGRQARGGGLRSEDGSLQKRSEITIHVNA